MPYYDVQFYEFHLESFDCVSDFYESFVKALSIHRNRVRTSSLWEKKFPLSTGMQDSSFRSRIFIKYLCLGPSSFTSSASHPHSHNRNKLSLLHHKQEGVQFRARSSEESHEEGQGEGTPEPKWESKRN